MNRDLTDFLEDILAYSKRAQEIVQTINIATLTEFSIESLALVRCLEVIGEAVKHIPQEVRDKYPVGKWKVAAGMRDVLAHQYWSADMARLIETVEKDLPELEQAVKKILQELEN